MVIYIANKMKPITRNPNLLLQAALDSLEIIQHDPIMYIHVNNDYADQVYMNTRNKSKRKDNQRKYMPPFYRR
jgi:hypothetical protein